MLLTIDIGNTNVTLGLYEGETLKRHWRMATNHERMPDEYGLMQMASDMGGYTVSSSRYRSYSSSGDTFPAANVVIRVPADKLNTAMDQIKAMTGDAAKYVTNESVTGEDVTKAYTDLQSRLRNLQQAADELSKMYEKAEKADDVLAIYNQKMQVTEQIEVIKGQMQYYEEASATSSITIDLEAKASVQPITVAGWQPTGIMQTAFCLHFAALPARPSISQGLVAAFPHPIFQPQMGFEQVGPLAFLCQD